MTKETTLQNWIDTTPESYDCKDVFHKEVEPLIEMLHAKCVEHNMPFYVRVVHAQTEEGTSNSVSYNLAGPGRATPEIFAFVEMEQFLPETPERMEMLVKCCNEKYNGGADIQAILMDSENADDIVRDIDTIIGRILGEK